MNHLLLAATAEVECVADPGHVHVIVACEGQSQFALHAVAHGAVAIRSKAAEPKIPARPATFGLITSGSQLQDKSFHSIAAEICNGNTPTWCWAMKVILIVPFSRDFDSFRIGDEHESIPVVACDA